MAENRFELRPLRLVAASYVIAPLIAITAYWLVWIVPSLVGPPFAWRQALVIWGFMVVIGGAVCVVVELVLVTPILIGFQRYRWKWLNGWSAAAMGFMVGALFAAAIGSLPPVPGSSESGQYGVVFVANGVRTAEGWKSVLTGSFLPGVTGMIAAIVIRLIAVRKVLIT